MKIPEDILRSTEDLFKNIDTLTCAIQLIIQHKPFMTYEIN